MGSVYRGEVFNVDRTMEKFLLPLHLVATIFMSGVIWFVQLVHYPLFLLVGREGFELYEKRHCDRTSMVVIPAMLIEAGTGIVSLYIPHHFRMSYSEAVFGVCLIVAVWVSTFLLQVPCHTVLQKGFSEGAWRRLVITNWLRTLLWSTRGGFIAFITFR